MRQATRRARTLLDFNPQACDPDALSHIADALLAQGFVNEMIELMTGFLPSLRENADVNSWVLPQAAEEIFLLRLGSLIASGDYSSQPIDLMIAGNRHRSVFQVPCILNHGNLWCQNSIR